MEKTTGPGYRIEDYDIQQLLGKGGFAKVFKAKPNSKILRQKMAPEVAIKMINKSRMEQARMEERVQQEVYIHSRLNHRAVLKVYAYFQDDYYVYLVLELCHNGELQQYLKQNDKKLSENEASHILKQVVEGLIYLHQHNIIHRDITLGNLLLTHDMQVKIADFGLATQLRSDEKHYTICGTPNFISPEIVERKSHGLEADVWGLGCILYTLLVGRPPFDTDGVKSTLIKVAMAEYKVPPEVSADARDLIEKLLKKDPVERIHLRDVLNHPFLQRDALTTQHNILRNDYLNIELGDSGMCSMTTEGTNSHQREKESFNTKCKQPVVEPLTLESVLSGKHKGSRNSSTNSGSNRHFSKEQNLYHYPGSDSGKISSYSAGKNIVTSETTRSYDQTHYSAPSMGHCHKDKHTHKDDRGLRNINRLEESPDRFDDDEYLHMPCAPVMHRIPAPARTRSRSEDRGTNSSYLRNRLTVGESQDNILPTRHSRDVSSSQLSQQNSAHCLSSGYNNSRLPRSYNHDKISRTTENNDAISPRYYTRNPALDCQPPMRRCNSSTDATRGGALYQNSVDWRDKGISEGWQQRPRSRQEDDIKRLEKRDVYGETDILGRQRSLEDSLSSKDVLLQQLFTISTLEPAITSEGQNAEPLSTARLLPTRHRTKNAILSITDDGEVVIEFMRKKEEKVIDVCRISSDGSSIRLYQPNGKKGCPIADTPPLVPLRGHVDEFSFENLPSKHRKKYIYASRFVNLVRAKTPKITFYSDRAKSVLMENQPLPDFESCFYEGGKVAKTSDGIRLIRDMGKTNTTIDSLDAVEKLSPAAKLQWDHFVQCYKHCVQLERCQSSIYESLDKSRHMFPIFPIIVGRRPNVAQSPGILTEKENVNQAAVISPNTPMFRSFECSAMSFTPPTVSTKSSKALLQYTPVSRSLSNRVNRSDKTSNPVLRFVVIPNVGTVTEFMSGEIRVTYLDNSELTVYAGNLGFSFAKPDGEIDTQCGPNEEIPARLRVKITQLPDLIACLDKQGPVETNISRGTSVKYRLSPTR